LEGGECGKGVGCVGKECSVRWRCRGGGREDLEWGGRKGLGGGEWLGTGLEEGGGKKWDG